MEIINLQDVIKMLPRGIGLYIAEKSFRENKRYCCGQPQLQNGDMMFSDKPEYFSGRPDFPSMILDCKDYLKNSQSN